jgi:hypothetical protein
MVFFIRRWLMTGCLGNVRCNDTEVEGLDEENAQGQRIGRGLGVEIPRV